MGRITRIIIMLGLVSKGLFSQLHEKFSRSKLCKDNAAYTSFYRQVAQMSSVAGCVAECAQDRSCRSLVYDADKSVCNLTSFAHTNKTTACSYNYEYGERTQVCPISGVNVRLMNGSDCCAGRVEIFMNNAWGTVCDDSFVDNERKVTCKMLGYSSGIYRWWAYYGQGSGTIHEIRCSGTETDIFSCNITSNTNCYHNEDVGVDCCV